MFDTCNNDPVFTLVVIQSFHVSFIILLYTCTSSIFDIFFAYVLQIVQKNWTSSSGTCNQEYIVKCYPL